MTRAEGAPAPTPVCGFDVMPDGRALPVAAGDIALTGPQGSAYRWLHFDLNDPALGHWAEAHLPRVASTALLQSETRPRCDAVLSGAEPGLIVNLRGVNLNPGAEPEDMVSLRLWVTKGCIISARFRKVWAADTLRQDAENGQAPASIGGFLTALTQGLTRRIEAVTLELEERTDASEEALLGDGPATELSVPSLRQEVIKLRRFVTPQREALVNLSEDNSGLFPDQTEPLHEVANHTKRITEELDATRERLAVLQDHIDAQKAAKLSRDSHVLSVIAAIFLPLGFLSGLFGVNVGGMPGMENPTAFWILCALCALLGLGLYLWFKLTKWL
ncbi:zinc transporter ZntB [Harenicola maris]|uniref:zinc transporter ZntB n=1 Tax=Harenicola maris TaxID=2841044 RepID=UPI002E16D8CF